MALTTTYSSQLHILSTISSLNSRITYQGPIWQLYLEENPNATLPLLTLRLWDLQEIFERCIWDQYLWWVRVQEAALHSVRSWNAHAVTSEASAHPTGSSETGTEFLQLRQERSILLHEPVIGCRLPPERGITLSRQLPPTKSSPGKDSAWALSRQHPWQLGNGWLVLKGALEPQLLL